MAVRAALLFGPAAAWVVFALIGLARAATDGDKWRQIDRGSQRVVGSDGCIQCHPVQHESWHATYHRTMTQRVSEDSVLAPFGGESLDYLGFRATMSRNSSGKPQIHVVDPTGGTVLASEVELTVGSHRYQQYVGRLSQGSTELHRLPVAWHIAEGRWIHMNGAFVEPEADAGDRDGYLRHLSRWNDNCVFCHNTEPNPGRQEDGRFDTRVGEVGIACEACHGPAGGHIDRHADLFRRLLATGGDGSIAQPSRLAPLEESAICGRCHGQRIGRDIDKVLRNGDGFVPGMDLATVSRPVFRDSLLGGQAVFESRFWPDGTPRLSAYEYQGLLLSPCYSEGQQGGLGCNHCHDMHGNRPDGQVRTGHDSSGACAGCHELEPEHGGHGDIPSVDCMDCHMPRITYGLLEGMISHRITNPDPGFWAGRSDQPDACTQCHVDQTRNWAARSMSSLGLKGTAASGADDLWPQVVADLVGGDPLQRNLAAHALAHPDAVGSAESRMGALLVALDDEYPSVRWFAWRGLRTLAQSQSMAQVLEVAARFDYLGEIETRAEVVSDLDRLLPPGLPDQDPTHTEVLRASRLEREIWIGE